MTILVKRIALFLILLVAAVAHHALPAMAAEEDEHGHGHEDEHEDEHGDEHTMELQMVFPAMEGGPVHLLWTKPEHEEKIKLYFVEVGDGVECGEAQKDLAELVLEEMEEQLEALELNYTEIEPMQLISGTIAAEMHGPHEGEEEVGLLTYMVQFPQTNCTAVFSKHSAEEMGLFFYNVTSGQIISPSFMFEPVEEAEESFAVSEVAGTAIGAAILVSLIPFFLLAILLPIGFLRNKDSLKLVFFFLQAFGCGALLAVVTLHLYPEVVLELEEYEIPLWHGAALTLAAICTIATIHFAAHGLANHTHDMDAETAAGKVSGDIVAAGDAKDVEAISVASSVTSAPQFRWGTPRDIINFRSVHPLVWGLTVGDALHNFVDGTIVATAFLTCGTTTGWVTVGAIIAHEIPQELGDFSVMLAKGTPVIQAAAFNLFAQFFALIGCGVLLGVGANISKGQLALLIAFGTGMFLFIALAEIMPMLLKARKPLEMFLVAFGLLTAFTAIGLSTLGDKSCGGHSH